MADAERGWKWRKSTRCDSGACLEVAVRDDRVLIRESDRPDGPWLEVSRASWTAFVRGVRAGEFDRPG
jgi:Domain of unknown function (DUF397)